MDVTPRPPAAIVKPDRTKPGIKTQNTAPASRKAVASRKKPKPAPVAQTVPSDHEVRRGIAEAAYFIAAERGFDPGKETEDWLKAERQILGL